MKTFEVTLIANVSKTYRIEAEDEEIAEEEANEYSPHVFGEGEGPVVYCHTHYETESVKEVPCNEGEPK